MFQGKVRKVLVQTVHDHVHQVHPLLQLRNPIFPLPLHSVQQKDGSRMPSFGTRHGRPGVFVSSSLPEFGGSIVSGKELHGHLIVMGNVGRSIVQMVLHVEGSFGLKRRSKVEGGSSSVEDSVVGNERGHGSKGWLEGSGWFGGSGKETMEGTIINPPDLNTS
jgi:hypothetical protein